MSGWDKAATGYGMRGITRGYPRIGEYAAIGARRVWFLHDARATDLRTVIELHNGEAKSSRDRLLKRPRNDLQDLLAFLRSL